MVHRIVDAVAEVPWQTAAQDCETWRGTSEYRRYRTGTHSFTILDATTFRYLVCTF